jgi:hypothetical protein
LPAEEVAALFSSISGSDEWAREMASLRPFAMVDDLLAAAERCWAELSPAEVLTALGRDTGQIADRLSEGDKAQTDDADDVFNLYRQRIGSIVLTDTPSGSVDELADSFGRRKNNSAESELAFASKKRFMSIRKSLFSILEQ